MSGIFSPFADLFEPGPFSHSDGPPRGSPPVREPESFGLLDAPLALFVVAVRRLNYTRDAR